jgi:hypothetical protein
MKAIVAILFAIFFLASCNTTNADGSKCYPKAVEYICDKTNVLEACREACPGISDCDLINAVINSKCRVFQKEGIPSFTCDPNCGK